MKCVQSLLALLLLNLLSFKTFAQANNHKDYWLSFSDTVNDWYGYKTVHGDTAISLSKYSMCFTDTFRTYAIVLIPHKGFVAIDKKEHVLYQVFAFDNGPDVPSEGLFRIMGNNKIGYADAVTGKIIVPPQFACAFPFENGCAKVSVNCSSVAMGEHTAWKSSYWFYIDKHGKKIDKKAD